MAAKKTSTTAKPKSKTAYVLGLPLEMSPADVVAKAKAEGIALTPNYVSNIRSSAKTKKKAKRAEKTATKASSVKKAATKKAAPKKSGTAAVPVAPSATPSTTPTATEFIASQARDIPAAAVVKAAKRAGLKINAGYVYKVRSRTAATAGKAPAAKPVEAPKAVAAPKASTTEKRSVAKKTPATKKASAPKLATTAKAVSSNVEGTFKRMIVEMGVSRAIELVAEVRRTLAELFGAG
jgi:hypothetical protein